MPTIFAARPKACTVLYRSRIRILELNPTKDIFRTPCCPYQNPRTPTKHVHRYVPATAPTADVGQQDTNINTKDANKPV